MAHHTSDVPPSTPSRHILHLYFIRLVQNVLSPGGLILFEHAKIMNLNIKLFDYVACLERGRPTS